LKAGWQDHLPSRAYIQKPKRQCWKANWTCHLPQTPVEILTNRQSWKTTWQCHSLQALVEANTKTSRCEDWLAKFWRLQAVPNLKLENQKTMFADRLECHLLEALVTLVEILKQPMSENHLAVSLAPSQALV
jgi:hypothetical protein